MSDDKLFSVILNGYEFRSTVEILRELTPNGGIFNFHEDKIFCNSSDEMNSHLINVTYDTSKLKYKILGGPIIVNFDLEALHNRISKVKKKCIIQIDKECDDNDIYLKFNNPGSNQRMAKLVQSEVEKNVYDMNNPLEGNKNPSAILTVSEFKEYCDTFGKNDRGKSVHVDVGRNWVEMSSSDEYGGVEDQLTAFRYPDYDDDIVREDVIFGIDIRRDIFKTLSKFSNISPNGNLSFFYYSSSDEEYYILKISTSIGFSGEISIYFKTPK